MDKLPVDECLVRMIVRGVEDLRTLDMTPGVMDTEGSRRHDSSQKLQNYIETPPTARPRRQSSRK